MSQVKMESSVSFCECEMDINSNVNCACGEDYEGEIIAPINDHS